MPHNEAVLMSEQNPINFTIVADENDSSPRIYANFCNVAHTPFDVTLTFCEIMPLSQKDIESAKKDQTVRAPVRAEIVVPLPVVPTLIASLQEHIRAYNDSSVQTIKPEKPIH
jgi:hypothetical protein|tara:strand:- start:2525 stop:2863 length:339 start_codon:yes stop_codon:yes gene_type:complete